VRRLSDLPTDEAAAELRTCCASERWVTRMLSQRPFKDRDEVFASAERIWLDLGREDWLEAFRAHSRIGERHAEQPAGQEAAAHAAREQAGMDTADAALRDAMAQANRDYEARFGWIYLVCATGRTAEQLLAFARERMANDPDAELTVAAAEQAKITRRRLITTHVLDTSLGAPARGVKVSLEAAGTVRLRAMV